MEVTEILRRMVGERIPSGGTDADTNFLDTEIQELLTYSQEKVNLAAALIWRMKAAAFADLVDMAESGSERKLSQLHEHALEMEERYAELAGEEAEALLASMRAAPRSARWAVPADEKVPYPIEISSGGQTVIRNYPLMRAFYQIKY